MTWKRHRLILRPESGAAIHRSRANDQFNPTLDFLPGSAVRGAFAQLFINKKGVNDPAFQEIFAEGRARFGDFWPINRVSRRQTPVLLPATAMACKREKLKHPESLRDQLFPALRRSAQSVFSPPTCGACKGELDHAGGAYLQALTLSEEERIENGKDGSTKTWDVQFSKRLRMHVGVSRATNSAVHGMLFSHELLEPRFKWNRNAYSAEIIETPLYFTGYLSLPEKDDERLKALIDETVAREHLSIGAARTRGQGEFMLIAEKGLPEDHLIKDESTDAATLEERWNAFQEKAKAATGDDTHWRFSLTLQSHLMLLDPLGRPVLGSVAAGHFGLPKGCKRIFAALDREIVSGWNPAQGLPKPDAAVLERGSVLAFEIEKSAVTEKDLIETLKTLENTGIGERRAEGFGEIAVCHPFHMTFSAR